MNIKNLSKLEIELRDPKNIDKVSEIDLTEVMRIDEEHMTREYDTVCTLYTIISVLSGYSQDKTSRAKFDLETIEASLDHMKRLELKNNEEKVTESMILNAVKLDKRYQEAYLCWLDAKKQYVILSKIENALQLKKDILMNLAADIRASNR